VKIKRYLSCVDTHSAGESTRILIGGIPKLKGKTMQEKQDYFKEYYDDLRSTMLKEPRGFSGLLGAVITEPCSEQADVGVIYLWTDGYFSACGDSTYSCSAALIDLGMIERTEPITEIKFDTIAGLVSTRVKIMDNNIESIVMQGVPSFYYKTETFNIPDIGKVEADIAYGGLWYAFIEAESIGIEPDLDTKEHWISLGWGIRNYIADNMKVDHPEYPSLNILDLVTFYTEPSNKEADTRHWNVFGPKQSCRSPAGTCTNARMAALYGKGDLDMGEEFVAESTIGTLHSGRIAREVKIGEYNGIIPEVEATAYVTSLNQIVVDPEDPLKQGFQF
jgi:proline racemase/trans-L-3-hydroxyproline dehydratase